MAEEKKDKKPGDKKPAPAPVSNLAGIEMVLAAFIFLAVVGAILERIYSFLSTGDITFYGISLNGAQGNFKDKLPLIKVITFSLSGVFAFGTIVFSQLRGTVLIAERKKISPDGEPKVSSATAEDKNPMKDKWKQIMTHVGSEQPSDWRLAIIEADVMLAELLEKMNLPGDTVGEKLKAVEKSDFVTIDMAWEAHKVRNQIAHEGSEFLFNDREARRVIGLYQKVFEEFFLI